MIIGSIVALVTPMLLGTEAIDFPALRRLVDWHHAAGTAAILAVGTTGESPTLSVEEHLRVVEVCVAQAAGRIPIIAGTGANSTAEAIELTEGARERGADACLLVTPYYNKPTQEGLYRHFRAVAEAVAIDQILYNVPGRTGCDLVADTVVRLAEIPNIVGIKEATGDLGRARDLIARCPGNFAVYSGDDATAKDLMLLGGKGTIGVTANVAPEQMRALCAAALGGDRERAAAIDERLLPLHRALFLESNPIPVKWAVAQLGLMADAIRLPLTPLSPSLHARVREAMQYAGLL